ncbi:MAG: septum formation initiator family protein [Candidatus Falkowbacteria bacterium]|nr:septum formation initiator family protein [Candidatus Falkowbacteria bacterium]
MTKNKLSHQPRVASFGAAPDNFWYRFFSSQRFLAIIGLVFLVVIIFPLAKAYSQRRLVENEINEVKKQISDYENQNQQLKELASYLQSEQSLEEQARLNLNMKKPGEAVVVIEGSKNNVVSIGAASSDENVSNLVKWWRYYFN